MLGLWKNESIKIFRPVANKIILIIAVLLIAVPGGTAATAAVTAISK